MTFYVIEQRAFLFPTLPAAGTDHPILEPGDVVEGSPQDPFFHKVKSGAKDGFVDNRVASPIPQQITTIATPADEDTFAELTTIASRREKSDRDYLLSVAHHLSADGEGKLKNFGQPLDDRVGPFRLGIADWLKLKEKARLLVPPQNCAVVDIFAWNIQPNLAAIRAGEAAKTFEEALKRPAMSHELFFFERLELGASELVDLLASDKQCKDAFGNAAKKGTYAEEIQKKDAKPIKDFVKEVQDGLKKGYEQSRPAVLRLPPHLRFFHDEDWAPWLAVARLLKGTNLQTSTEKFPALFVATGIGGGSRSSAFVTFCMQVCGDDTVKKSLPAAGLATPGAWKDWATAAPEPAPAGAVVVIKAPAGGTERVGVLAEPATGNTLQVYVCSAAGPIDVTVETIDKSLVTSFRWLDLTADQSSVGQPFVRGSGSNLFEQMAPQIMSRLLEDFKPRNLTVTHAAAILGNIGHECGGFRLLQELKPTGQDGRGGWGWCQWTDSRRTLFMEFAKGAGLAPDSPEANYGFLLKELKMGGSHQRAMDELLKETELRAGVETFEKIFEVAAADAKAYPERERYGIRALDAFKRANP
jgi:hypothetical protein